MIILVFAMGFVALVCSLGLVLVALVHAAMAFPTVAMCALLGTVLVVPVGAAFRKKSKIAQARVVRRE